MEIINKYINHLVFTRLEEKEGFTIYGAGVIGSLGAGKERYILLFVPTHLAIKNQAHASELPWQNLQTRTLTYGYKLKKQAWNPSRDLPDFGFQVMDRNAKFTEYRGPPQFEFEVLLLHDPRKKTKYQYPNKMTLYFLLDTFNSVFNYVGDLSPIHFTSGPSTLPPPVNIPPESPFSIFKPNTWKQQTSGVNDQFELL